MSDKDIGTMLNPQISRRTFLKWSAVVSGSAALVSSGLNGGLPNVEASALTAAAPKAGKWIAAACWGNCGGRHLNKAFVVDGVVTKAGTDDTHADTPDYPQQRGCARGRAQQQQAFGADRIKYPMKRKNWAPGGGKRELRGRDEWVRISWDEALNSIASEIKRIKEAYGNTAILKGGYSWSFTKGKSEPTKMLWGYGGVVEPWGITSAGTWQNVATYAGSSNINDRFDLRNVKLFIMWGTNPSWSKAGNPTYHLLQAKKAGAKFIFIDPFYNPTAQVMADEWVPIRPATDHALALGLAHTLITEDDPATNPLIDWDFLNRCTVGFDKDHMPKGADPKDNFKDYVLGTNDGVPKTAEWASQICGIPPAKIRSLAREMASVKKTALLSSDCTGRVHNSDSWPHAFMTLGWMMGHVGQSGRMTGRISSLDDGARLVTAGGEGLPNAENPLGGGGSTLPAKGIKLNYAETWNAVLGQPFQEGNGKVSTLDIRMIYHDSSAQLNQRVGLTKGIEAHRKVEFVVGQHFSLSTQCKYADIVLPITTQWEREGMIADGTARDATMLFSQITEPKFEAKHDRWVAEELAKRLGVDATKFWPISEKQMLFNTIAGTKVVKDDNSGSESLVTITAADIAEWGVDAKPQQGRISLKEFQEKGIYQVKRAPNDKFMSINLDKFRKDPEANKVATATGKLEIYSQAYADLVNKHGWTTIKPIPTYNPAIEGYEDTFSDFKSKAKGEFPLQLYTIHYLRRSHSAYDNLPWLREAFPEEFMMNPIDAAARGIKQGDTVLIRSRHGKVLRPVMVTERMMPGVTTLGEGAWVDMDENTGIDVAGATNTLAGPIPTGQGHQGWNSNDVQVEKWNGPALTPDYKVPQRIIFPDGGKNA